MTILLIWIATTAAGCSRILQPSREEIVKANSYLCSAPLEVHITAKTEAPDTTFSYDATVLCYDGMASWNGTAYASYKGMRFAQSCFSVFDGERAAKQWRGKWCRSDTGTPQSFLIRCIEAIEAGDGLYDKKPQSPALAEHPETDFPCYCFHFTGRSIPMNDLCDANIDKLFGGDELLLTEGATIALYFRTDTLQFCAAAITVNKGDQTQTVCLSATESAYDSMPAIEIPAELDEGLLSEEWQLQ